MRNTLLLCASALAMTAGTAVAQVVPLGTPDSVTAVTINTQTTVPIIASEETPFRDANRSRNRSGTTSSFESAGPVGQFYVNQVAAEADVQDMSAAGNKAAIDVDGDSNTHTVDQQGGDAGWAAIRQTGNNANADIDQNDQGASSSRSTDNAALIQQVSATTGASQLAEINQLESAPFLVLSARNNAAILQGGVDGGAAGRGNTARIDQNGTGLDASVVQGASAASSNQNNAATIIQRRLSSTTGLSLTSNRNRAGIQQKANGDAVILQQNASLGSAFVVQADGTDLDADVIQEGVANNASVFQDLSTGTADSYVNQIGATNEAFVDQSGNLTNGVSELFQTGISNSMVNEQSAAATASALMSQNGIGNLGTVRQ